MSCKGSKHKGSVKRKGVTKRQVFERERWMIEREREREREVFVRKRKHLHGEGDICVCCVKFCEWKRLLKKKEK